MKLRDYLKKLEEIVEEYPDALELNVVEACAGEEGTVFYEAVNVPVVGIVDLCEHTFNPAFMDTKHISNAICIN